MGRITDALILLAWYSSYTYQSVWWQNSLQSIDPCSPGLR
jgi:hypothetical protein